MGSGRSGSSVVSRSRQRPLRATVWCALCAWLWLSPSAWGARAADAEPRSAVLVVEADARCIDAAELRARVASNAWRWVERPSDQAELRLAASVQPQGREQGGLQVTLQLRRRDGRSAERTLAAQSCEAALDALALLIQMTLDAETRSQEAPALTTDSARSADSQGQDAAWSAVTQLVVGVSTALSAGAAPALHLGLGAYAALELLGFGLVRPRLQLEFSHAWRSGVAVDGGTADFALTAGQLLACPVGAAAGALAAHGCGTLEVGRVWAQGRDVYEPRAADHAWASAGLGVLLHARPVSRLELQLEAALSRPLWRDRFSFAPDVFYAVPAWRWQIKLGLAVCFL